MKKDWATIVLNLLLPLCASTVVTEALILKLALSDNQCQSHSVGKSLMKRHGFQCQHQGGHFWPGTVQNGRIVN